MRYPLIALIVAIFGTIALPLLAFAQTTIPSPSPSVSTTLPAALPCDRSVSDFRASGKIVCGHISWDLTPADAVAMGDNVVDYLLKYEKLYVFLKDFTGYEPPDHQMRFYEQCAVSYAGDCPNGKLAYNYPAYTIGSTVYVNQDLIGRDFVFLAKDPTQPMMSSLAHEMGHVFTFPGNPASRAYLWDSTLIEAMADVVGVEGYTVNGELTPTLNHQWYWDQWCLSRGKSLPCSDYFSTYADYASASDESAYQSYVSQGGSFDTLFSYPPNVNDSASRSAIFSGMIYHLYLDFTGRGQKDVFLQALKKTFNFYNSSWGMPTAWNVDTGLQSRAVIVQKANVFVFLMSAYGGKDLTSIFQAWHWPIASTTQDAIVKYLAQGQDESTIQTYLAPILAHDFSDVSSSSTSPSTPTPTSTPTLAPALTPTPAVTPTPSTSSASTTTPTFLSHGARGILDTSATVFWLASVPVTIDLYTALAGKTPSITITTQNSLNGGAIQLSSLTPGTSYDYVIRGHSSDGQMLFANGRFATTGTAPVPFVPAPVVSQTPVTFYNPISASQPAQAPKPKPPTPDGISFAETGTSNSLKISWHSMFTSVYPRLSVYRSTDMNIRGSFLAYLSSDGTPWYDNSLDPGGQYYYQFIGVDASGNESNALGAHVRISPYPTLSPQNVHVAASDAKSITLGWTIPSYYTSARSVTVYRSTKASDKGTKIAQNIKGNSYVDVFDRKANTRYYYTVRVVNSLGFESLNENRIGVLIRAQK